MAKIPEEEYKLTGLAAQMIQAEHERDEEEEEELEEELDPEFESPEAEEEWKKEVEEVKKLEKKPQEEVPTPPKIKKKVEPLPVPEVPNERLISEQEFYAQRLQFHQLHVLKNSNIQVEPHTLRDELNKLTAYQLHELNEYAKHSAQQETEAYRQQKLIPMANAQLRKGVVVFTNSLLEDFPDIVEYSDAMAQLYEEMSERHPWIKTDPVRALPLLYMKAKEKNMLKNRPTRKGTVLERGAARMPKGAGRSRGKDEEAMDRAFGTGVDKKDSSELGKLWSNG